jgi:uncharacterized alpha-E superfamily protein
MLSRTADSLFWMARYIERAENTARLLDVQRQAVLLPSAFAVQSAGYEQALIDLVTDAANPSSIISCISAGRENCRIVRGTVNTEIWETVNATWLELRSILSKDRWRRDPTDLLEWVKMRSHLFRGVAIGTMLKDEAFHFMRLGTFIERADSTARILDAKFDLEEEAKAEQSPQSKSQSQSQSAEGASAEGRADYYYWASVLRAVSALEIYRKVYRDSITPRRVAELLIQRADMPRSLLACLSEVCVNLDQVSGGEFGEPHRIAGRLKADLQYLRIDDSFEKSIHVFLKHFLEQMYQLGTRVSHEYLGASNA